MPPLKAIRAEALRRKRAAEATRRDRVATGDCALVIVHMAEVDAYADFRWDVGNIVDLSDYRARAQDRIAIRYAEAKRLAKRTTAADLGRAIYEKAFGDTLTTFAAWLDAQGGM